MICRICGTLAGSRRSDKETAYLTLAAGSKQVTMCLIRSHRPVDRTFRHLSKSQVGGRLFLSTFNMSQVPRWYEMEIKFLLSRFMQTISSDSSNKKL